MILKSVWGGGGIFSVVKFAMIFVWRIVTEINSVFCDSKYSENIHCFYIMKIPFHVVCNWKGNIDILSSVYLSNFFEKM